LSCLCSLGACEGVVAGPRGCGAGGRAALDGVREEPRAVFRVFNGGKRPRGGEADLAGVDGVLEFAWESEDCEPVVYPGGGPADHRGKLLCGALVHFLQTAKVVGLFDGGERVEVRVLRYVPRGRGSVVVLGDACGDVGPAQ
jgi:hypothetical protein